MSRYELHGGCQVVSGLVALICVVICVVRVEKTLHYPKPSFSSVQHCTNLKNRWNQNYLHCPLTYHLRCWASVCREIRSSRCLLRSQPPAESYTHDCHAGPAAAYATHTHTQYMKKTLSSKHKKYFTTNYTHCTIHKLCSCTVCKLLRSQIASTTLSVSRKLCFVGGFLWLTY